MNSRYLIISDIHFGAGNAESDQKTLDLLTAVLGHYAADEHCELVLAGDVFDYWMEYPNQTVPAFGIPLLETIRARFSGRARFIPGNHDVWEYGYFNRFGIENAGPFIEINRAPHEILIFHGDGTDHPALELPLPFLHRTIRKSGFVTRFQRIFPPRAGWFIMKYFSRINHLKDIIRPRKTDLIRIAFENRPDREKARVFIAGHEHQPLMVEDKNSVYLNCGNFSTQQTFAYLSPAGADLLRWNVPLANPEMISRFQFHDT